MIYIDIHTHKDYSSPEYVTVKNVYPGEGFGAFHGYNYYSIGLHPWHIKSKEENNRLLKLVEEAAKLDHVAFIGECGLDKLCGTNQEEQERVFLKQVDIAERLNKPLIIHCVKSYDRLLEFRKNKTKTPWILHGFGGPFEQAEQLAQFGLKFSFGKNLLNEQSKAQDACKNLPLGSFYIETDEYSGSIEDIYQKVSELKEMDITLLSRTQKDLFTELLEKG